MGPAHHRGARLPLLLLGDVQVGDDRICADLIRRFNRGATLDPTRHVTFERYDPAIRLNANAVALGERASRKFLPNLGHQVGVALGRSRARSRMEPWGGRTATGIGIVERQHPDSASHQKLILDFDDTPGAIRQIARHPFFINAVSRSLRASGVT